MYISPFHQPINSLVLVTVFVVLSACGGGDGNASSGNMAPTLTQPGYDAAAPETDTQNQPIVEEGYSSPTSYATDYCTGGTYPEQWVWRPESVQASPRPATSGMPKITHIRNGVVIATYASLGGDVGRSQPDNQSGADNSVGPFRRNPYTQYQSGDVFEVYPAVYSGPDMQIYIGPNIANDAAYNANHWGVPSNITIRGVTVDGQRPVIVNPPSGATNANYNQALVYIQGLESSSGEVLTPSSNITIENIDIVDSPTGGFIGKAGIYVNGAANLTLRNMRIAGFKQHKINGLFGTPNNSGTLLLENVELDSNGGSSGPAHNVYINESAVDPNFTFKVLGSWSHDSDYGHALKSRAQRTIVEGSYLSGSKAAPGSQTEAYLLDVPNGGILIARNNIFVKGYSGNQSNGASITFGVERQDPTIAWGATIEHNTFVALSRYYDDARHHLYPMFISDKALGPKHVNHNVYVGYCPSGDPMVDFRGDNALTLNFNEIDQSFRLRSPILTGAEHIIGTTGYVHKTHSVIRATRTLGARD